MYTQDDIFPVVIQPTVPNLINLVVVDNKIDKKTGRLRAVIEADTSTMNIPLITKEVYAKAFLRSAVEYMGNDVGVVLEELKLIYARMKVIAEVNAIVAEGDKPDEKKFEAMVEQNLLEINHMMTNQYEAYRLRQELAAQGQALLDDFPTVEEWNKSVEDATSLYLTLPDEDTKHEETQEPEAA